MNTDSIKEKLKIIAKNSNIEVQNLLNKLGEERFLARLSVSKYKENLFLKGGGLLFNQFKNARRTQDIDFTIYRINNDIHNLIKIIREICEIDIDDGFVFKDIIAEVLEHPRMPYQGARIKLNFFLGKIKGRVRIDLALGDDVRPIPINFTVMKYKDKPFIGDDISLLVYPVEFIFSEKFQTIASLGSATSRMKDYYDVILLINSGRLMKDKLQKALDHTFKKRTTNFVNKLIFSKDDLEKLDTMWKHFLRKSDLKAISDDFKEIVDTINSYIEEL